MARERPALGPARRRQDPLGDRARTRGDPRRLCSAVRLLMARSNRPLVSADRLDALLGRLQLTGIRDQLDTLLDEASRHDLSMRETLALLCEREIARKNQRRIEMALKLAHFPCVRELTSFDFAAQPSVDPKQIRDLAAGRPPPNSPDSWGPLPRPPHNAPDRRRAVVVRSERHARRPRAHRDGSAPPRPSPSLERSRRSVATGPSRRCRRPRPSSRSRPAGSARAWRRTARRRRSA